MTAHSSTNSPSQRIKTDDTPLPGICDFAALDAALFESDDMISLFRTALADGTRHIGKFGDQDTAPDRLVHARSQLIDGLLERAWQQILGDTGDRPSLVAVGGCARGELLPGSDIDLLILLPSKHFEDDTARIEAFLALLWDIGLDVGHSVRTIDQCVAEAKKDITVITNLVESRLLTGSRQLYQQMIEATGPEYIWPTAEFFEAKLREQDARHKRFHDTGYKLEPNIKESPGGLRDIHTIGWVAKRHFNATTLHDLVDHNFLTEDEYHTLIDGQSFLWRIRFALHQLAGRREDRLLFDYQNRLAEALGYAEATDDGDSILAVERFMKDYFRSVMQLERLNEMLLQFFKEAILHAPDTVQPVALNARFRIRKGFIEVTSDAVFQRYPFALLEVFLLLAEQPEIDGIRAATIRLIREHLHLINDKFRNDLRCKSIFMEIVRQPQGVTHELRRMNRYGVLAAYIPAFGQIAGQMQYDLFHIYTVDEHTLFVVRNLRRFTIPEYARELPLCSELVEVIPKMELLVLAGLFHDIAKGRGGDHSELGASDAFSFCLEHGLSEFDGKLVAWLVRNHLLMSSTAQRRDISDPNVVAEFAQAAGTRDRLNYLYLLTVADIRGTNPELWNSWKNALLLELYTATARALRRGLGNPRERQEQLQEHRDEAFSRLTTAGYTGDRIHKLWRELSDEYFLRHTPDEIEWHTRSLVEHSDTISTMVNLRNNPVRGETEVFICIHRNESLFGRTTAILDQLGLSIVDARIIATPGGCALNTYLVLEEDGNPISSDYRRAEVIDRLTQGLSHPEDDIPRVTRPAPRMFRHFNVPTSVSFEDDQPNKRTILQLVTADRPGLLATVGQIFLECGVILHNARISTFGVRAEDVFYVTDSNNKPLDPNIHKKCLREKLLNQLNA